MLLGQAHFFRAWRYYLLVKMYGGVPIVDHVQNPVIGDGNGENLVIPRSSTKDCVKLYVMTWIWQLHIFLHAGQMMVRIMVV